MTSQLDALLSEEPAQCKCLVVVLYASRDTMIMVTSDVTYWLFADWIPGCVVPQAPRLQAVVTTWSEIFFSYFIASLHARPVSTLKLICFQYEHLRKRFCRICSKSLSIVLFGS